MNGSFDRSLVVNLRLSEKEAYLLACMHQNWPAGDDAEACKLHEDLFNTIKAQLQKGGSRYFSQQVQGWVGEIAPPVPAPLPLPPPPPPPPPPGDRLL